MDRGPASESLAAFIDPLLFSGGHTIREIAVELAKKAGDLAKGKDLEANCRADGNGRIARAIADWARGLL